MFKRPEKVDYWAFLIGLGIPEPCEARVLGENEGHEDGCRILMIKNKPLHTERVVVALHPAGEVVTVVWMVRKAGIREMIFPDARVIIPCSVLLKNRDCVTGTRLYSVS